MAIIVRHKDTKRVYVLIGTGYGAYKATRASLLGGNLFPFEEKGEIPVAAVSNQRGDIEWFYTEDLKVIEVDGLQIEAVLAPYGEIASSMDDDDESSFNICPACQSELTPEDKECPSCGLVFPEGEE